eukprot:9487319-Pyramimonas_sp.AAC.1
MLEYILPPSSFVLGRPSKLIPHSPHLKRHFHTWNCPVGRTEGNILERAKTEFPRPQRHAACMLRLGDFDMC